MLRSIPQFGSGCRKRSRQPTRHRTTSVTHSGSCARGETMGALDFSVIHVLGHAHGATPSVSAIRCLPLPLAPMTTNVLPSLSAHGPFRSAIPIVSALHGAAGIASHLPEHAFSMRLSWSWGVFFAVLAMCVLIAVIRCNKAWSRTASASLLSFRQPKPPLFLTFR